MLVALIREDKKDGKLIVEFLQQNYTDNNKWRKSNVLSDVILNRYELDHICSILDPTGECLAEPILLIDYYDVKAYHGATIGKISDDDLFYLMSRGLTKEEAFMLIINGLIEPFVKRIHDESIKEETMKAYYAFFE